MLVSVEFRHLKYFVAVAEEQNVTKAAARLHVSQPPLSRQIRDLESELGVKLFERSARSVRLTAEGRLFLNEARAVLRRAEEAIQTIRAAAGRSAPQINVAYAPSLTVELLPQILRLFQNDAPAVRVNLQDLSTQEMLEDLVERKLDVALMIFPGKTALPGLEFEALHSYAICVAAHPTHPLARSRSVTIQDLAKERLIAYAKAEYPEYHELLLSLFKPLKQLPPISEEHESSTSLIAAVEAGRGVALVPASLRCLTGSRLTLHPLRPSPPPLVVGLARRRGNPNEWLKRFIEAARKCQALRPKPAEA